MARVATPGAQLSGGAHTSRTMMLAELQRLLAALPSDAAAEDYRAAILNDNALAKSSDSARQRSFRYLRELYALDPSDAAFRVLRRLWNSDDRAQPLLALSSALRRDASLRGTAVAVLDAPLGSVVSAGDLSAAVQDAYPGSYGDAVAHKIGRNAASTWTQSGHLAGRTRKVRTHAVPTPQSVAYALFCAYLDGRQGELLFEAVEARAQDRPTYALRELARDASRRGLIDYRAAAGVTEVRFHELERERTSGA
jgi:hypothetical protein